MSIAPPRDDVRAPRPTQCLDGSGAPSDQVGGKGAALDRLIAAGFRVPATGVVTTDAYRSFIAEADLHGFLRDLRASALPSPDDVAAETRRIDAAFLNAPMAASTRREIIQLATEVGHGRPVAVRSSATAEDTDSASFAGQYRSELNRSSEVEVIEAVRLVWASLWHPAARTYRRFRGVDETDLAMAVVIMGMVDAAWAGVVFTADPGGTPDSVRLEAVQGLAEGLVSGTETPEAAVVARDKGERTWPAAISDLDPVVDVALSIEAAFAQPQDIEWAIDDRGLWIVQARPITVDAAATVVDRFDTEPGETDTWTTAGIAEMVPGVLSPLAWSVNGPALENAFRQLFADLVSLPEQFVESQALIGRIDGQAAMNLTLLETVASKLPGGSAAEIEQQYFGRVVSEVPLDEPSAGGLRSQIYAIRELALRKHLNHEGQAIVTAAETLAEYRPAVAEMGDEELVGYHNRLVDLGWRAIAAEVSVAVAAVASYRGLEQQLSTNVGAERASLIAQSLSRSGDGARLRALSIEADSSAAIFGGPTWAELGGNRGPADAGSPGVVAPELTAGLLREVEREISSSWRYRSTRVLTGQIVDVRRRLLRRLVTDARVFLARREETKSAVLRIGGELRRVHLEMGCRAASSGVIDGLDDVELLTHTELSAAVMGQGVAPSELHRRRRQLAAAVSKPHLPLRFTGRPPSNVVPLVARGTVLEGWAASAGTHTATARVLDFPSGELQSGEVLVARTTDPSWTPLFLRAGAIVVEEGGPLSHAAIVARELGVPAVLNIPGVVERVRRHDGDVSVDGTTGVVTLVDGAT